MANVVVLGAKLGDTGPAFVALPQMPALLARDKTLGHDLEEIHETVGTLGYYLVGLHAVAALFHHCVMRDDTLRRMLPRRRQRRALPRNASIPRNPEVL